MAARFRMCASKGFDAVEPDNIDGYENATGFPITAAQQLTYDEWVAAKVQRWGWRCCRRTTPSRPAGLQPHFDGVLDEQCNQYSECASFAPYLNGRQAGAQRRV